MIKPNVYYNVISYPNRYYGGWYNNYYQPSYNNYRPIYAPSKGSRVDHRVTITITIIIIIRLFQEIIQIKDHLEKYY